MLRLVHRGLDDLAAGAHNGGWTHYLDRLRRRAEGSTVGPDPFATPARPDTCRAAPMNEPMLPGEARFWDLAEPLLGRADVTRSTMMGLPCLRWNGAFFASCDRRTGDLLVKLAESRVDELVASGRAERVRAGRSPVPRMGRRPGTADHGPGSVSSTKPSSSRSTTRRP